MKRSVVNKRVGKAIQYALKRKGMTQTQLAKKIGMTQRSISAYIQGDQQPSLESLVIICETLHLNLNQILKIKDKTYHCRVLYDKEELDFMQILDEISEDKKTEFIRVVNSLKDLTNNT